MPSKATKPIAAEMLSGVPETSSVTTPPTSAIGMTEAASAMSRADPKLMNSSTRTKARLIGTSTCRATR